MINTASENQFYPTPPELALKVKGYIDQRIDNKTRILDGSAGEGALLEPFLEYLKSKHYGYRSESLSYVAKNLYAIEIEQNLRYVLSGKGFSVIGTDFLQFEEPVKFDIIVMNPPFRNGADHVLHAWDLLNHEGELVCLLNQETIDNPYTTKRKLLASIIETNGIKVNLGKVFQDADRKTDVEVVLIKLTKPKKLEESFTGFQSNNFGSDTTTDEDFAKEPLTRTDYIKNLVDRYKAAERALISRHESQKELNFYLKGVGGASYYRSQEETEALHSLESSISLEDQLQAIKLTFWDDLFSKSKLTNKATSDFNDKFMEFAKTQSKMAFSYENIIEVLITVLGNQDNIFKDAIDNLFKIGCSFDEDNKIHWEGWKTNDSWKWNKKLIIPYAFTFDKNRGFGISYGSYGDKAERFLDDLDKVLSNISGEPITVSSKEAYHKHIMGLVYHSHSYEISYSSWIETTFVKFRIYKKGTIHIEFLDQSLLSEFNRRAAEGKPWMPPNSSYRQPKYRQKQLQAA